MHSKRLFSYSLSALLFAGCSMAPQTQIPKSDLPKTLDNTSGKKSTIQSQWWKNFHDPNLNLLVDEALRNNDDLKLAVNNIQKARAQYGISEAALYPQIDLNANSTRQRKSLNSFPASFGGTYSDHGLSASTAYEIDFWGKIQNQKDADLALLAASHADKETLRITLIADVTSYYLNLISINQQMAIAKQTLRSYEQTLGYKQKQLKHGVVDELVVSQASAQVATANTLIYTIQTSKAQTQSALALLLGRTPNELFNKPLFSSKKLPRSVHIPSGLPADLMENRPDIKAAEKNIKAKTALIGVAKAAYFPNISLTGHLGYQSQTLSKLISSGSKSWAFGPSLNLPIFDFGAINEAVKVSEADQKAALITYDKTVKNAYKEVYEALEKIRISKLKEKAVQREVNAYATSYRLANKKLEYGTASYLDVLVTQKDLLNAKLSNVSAKTELLLDQVALYKALGCGWKAH